MLLILCAANLWATVVLLPALWAGHVVFALLPLAAGVAAVMRPRDRFLFGAFPVAIVIAAVSQPEATALLSRGPALGLAIFALLAYLFVAARAATRAEAARLPERTPTPLAATTTPAQKPGRVLFVFALVGPVVLLWAAILRPGAAADLATHHPDRPAAGALAICAAAALWTGLVVVYLRSAVPATGEQKRVRAELWALRNTLRRGRAGLLFYAAVGIALAGMATLVYLRYR